MAYLGTRGFRRRPLMFATGGVAFLLALTIGLTLLRSGSSVTSLEAADVSRAIYAQFQDESDTIYAAPLDSPTEATAVTTIAHASGWGIIGAVSPDGRWLAYTVLPPGARNPQTQAQGRVLSLVGGGSRTVADGVDLQVRPVWSSGSDRVAFTRGAAPEGALGVFTVLVATTSGNTTEAGVIDDALAANPIGFAASGSVLVAVSTPDGTRLDSLDGGARGEIASLSASIARDFALSPDGTKLAYVEIAPGADPQVRLLGLTGGVRTSTALQTTSGGGATLGPVWSPGGDLSYGRAVVGSPALVLKQADLTAASAPIGQGDANGFDIPLGWSPDGNGLATRTVIGTLANVQSLRLAIISGNGARTQFGNADTKFLGWVPAGVGR